MKEHVRKICCSAYYQLRQLRVVRKSLSTKAWGPWFMPSSPVDWITAIACCTALQRSNWTSSNLYCVRPLVSYFANGSSTQSLPICETSYTGFPSNNQLNTRSACLSTSADGTKKCTTSIFPGHDLFVRVHEVFLCPVQLSGTVCHSLLKRLRHFTLGRSRKT